MFFKHIPHVISTFLRKFATKTTHKIMMIGRYEEVKILQTAAHADESKFVAVYGRRRVGKTFLVRETFNNTFAFYHTGLANESNQVQLAEFNRSLAHYGNKKVAKIKSWYDAFDQLAILLEQSQFEKKIIFIDEMPWMDCPRSSFLSALEHFWNGWASARKDILLIICGSATSWIINKVIKNHGGLHNRVSVRIHLKPFTLHECELYAKELNLQFNRRQVLEGYMIMGGVPFYWSQLQAGKSLLQNINLLFFSEDGVLRHEFADLYDSLFKKPKPYLMIINALATKKVGMTRTEILKATKMSDNGKLTEFLENLEYCGFIRKYNSIGMKNKNALYQLMDNYTLFYYKFIKDNYINDEQYWSKIAGKPEYNTWCGLAFERVCLQHIEQIKAKLGIQGIISTVYSWSIMGTKEKQGAQIDLLIDRSDDVINLCEIKYSKAEFQITSGIDNNLQNKRERFIQETRTRKAVHLTMITTMGLMQNSYAWDIQSVVTMDDLFI